MRHKRKQWYLLLLVLCMPLHGLAEDTAEQEESERADKESELARETRSFADFFRGQSKAAFKGVILGNVISITDDFLYVKPKEKSLGRMYIYFDKETEFSSINAGKRKKSKKTDLIDGQRIAVRVIIRDGIILADEIFLVEGEFDLLSRYRKRVFKAAPKKEGEGGEQKAEGGHDAAKPEEKKSGGH